MSVTFDNLKVLCVDRKNVSEALQEREEIDVDPFRSKYVVETLQKLIVFRFFVYY